MDNTVIVKADTIEQYNRFFGFETRHPQVGIVHFDESVPQPTHRMSLGFYALFLKKTTGCIINYGKTVYDFYDETVVSLAPGQTIGVHRLEDGPAPEAVGLLFHPDFLHRTSLGQRMKQYSFFSYASHEALHFERLLDDYLYSGSGATLGIPTVKYFADQICLSSNYFGDLVKQETGKTAQEYIQLKMIAIAKERMLDPTGTIKQIAESLGFQHP